jgi:hypothetical protein
MIIRSMTFVAIFHVIFIAPSSLPVVLLPERPRCR